MALVIGPGKVNIPFLEQVAAQYVGEPVTVRVEPLPGLWGIAKSENFLYQVEVTEGLSLVDFCETFFHELGHIQCGHIKRASSSSGRDIHEVIAEYRARAADPNEPEREFAHAMANELDKSWRRREMEADSWAAEHLRQWEKEHGYFVRAAFSMYEGDRR